MRFYLLPACSESPRGRSPRDHYRHTIDRSVDFSVYHDNGTISKGQWKEILSVFPSGKARVWGSLPTSKTKDDGSKEYLDKPPSSYETLKHDDIIFTYINWSDRKHRIDAMLTCGLKIHNRGLAEQLWDKNDDGETWEYIFLLNDYTQLDYPSEDFFNILGYSNPPNGFTPISKEKHQKLINKFGGLTELFEHLKTKNIDYESFGTTFHEGTLMKPSERKKSSRISSGNEKDYLDQQKENSKTGYAGEKHVIAWEKKILMEKGRSDLIDEIEHTSRINDDAGYDIRSFFPDGEVKYIEVKSTQSSPTPNTSFYLSQNEFEKAKQYGEKYCIYRVFNARDDQAIIIAIDNVSKKIEEGLIDMTPAIYHCRISYV